MYVSAVSFPFQLISVTGMVVIDMATLNDEGSSIGKVGKEIISLEEEVCSD